MKVLCLFQGLPHYYNYVLNRLHAMEGIEIVCIVPRSLSSGVGAGVFQTRKDVEYSLIEMDEYRPLYGRYFFKDFARVLWRERPDIIMTSESHLRGFICDLPTVFMCKWLNIRLILKTHPFRLPKYDEVPQMLKKQFGNGDRKPTLMRWIHYWLLMISRPLRRVLYRYPDAFVCYVQEAFDIFASYGVKREKIFITYNSPDTDRLLAAHKKLTEGMKHSRAHPHRLIHVGRLVDWKRVDLLLRAVAQLHATYPDIELVVVGEGPQADEWKQLASDLGIESRVQFVGGVYEPESLGRYLMSSSIYVLAGMGGLSINDAMCFGLPVICSVCDGTEKHLVKEGYNGFFFREGDLESLCSAIDYFFAHLEQCAPMGQRSLEIIRNDVNIYTVLRGYKQAFEYVQRGHKRMIKVA